MKYEIKSWLGGGVLFAMETESLKLCLMAAVEVGADLSEADLSGANLSRADLSGAYLLGAHLSEANLSRADLSGTNLLKADLSRADLSEAHLSRADLSEACLFGADLSRAYLLGADLSEVNLSGANLSRANLSGANLSGANLSEAHLFVANLSGANLSRADLSGANLLRADLSGADLSEANLLRANLMGTVLSGAKGINKHLCTGLRILLDQPGKIRAYKLVTAEGESPMHTEKIKYEIGKVYSVPESDTDESKQCAAGISLATMDWCLQHWQDGWRILVAEFTAKDIACIPTATDGKFRVKRCKIVGEKNLADLDWPAVKNLER